MTWQSDDHPAVSEVWTMVDPHNAGNVSRQAIKDMDDGLLNKVANTLNIPHIPKHEEL